MLYLSETIDQLVVVDSGHQYGHVLRKALDFEVKGQRKKWRSERMFMKQVEKESVNVGLRMEVTLCGSKWSVGVNQIAAGLR